MEEGGMEFSIFIFTSDDELKRFFQENFKIYTKEITYKHKNLNLSIYDNFYGLFIFDYSLEYESNYFSCLAQIFELRKYIPLIIISQRGFEINTLFQNFTKHLFYRPLDYNKLKSKILNLFPSYNIPDEIKLKNLITQKYNFPICKIITINGLNYRRTSIIFKKRYACTPKEYANALKKLHEKDNEEK